MHVEILGDLRSSAELCGALRRCAEMCGYCGYTGGNGESAHLLRGEWLPPSMNEDTHAVKAHGGVSGARCGRCPAHRLRMVPRHRRELQQARLGEGAQVRVVPPEYEHLLVREACGGVVRAREGWLAAREDAAPCPIGADVQLAQLGLGVLAARPAAEDKELLAHAVAVGRVQHRRMAEASRRAGATVDGVVPYLPYMATGRVRVGMGEGSGSSRPRSVREGRRYHG